MEKIRFKHIHLFFIIFMLGYISLSYLVALVIPRSIPMWLNMCISEVVIITPIIFCLIWKKQRPKEFLLCSPVKIGDCILAYLGAYCLLPCVYLINLITSFFAKNYVNNLMAELYRYPLWLQLVLMALLPAIVEEFIFRGVFYGNYRKYNIILAAALSGLFFGIAHLNINQFAYAFVIGFAFCLMAEYSGNIIIPMIAHFAVNANTVFMLAMMKNYVDIDNMGETSASLEKIPAGMLMIELAVIFSFAVIGVFLFVLILRKLGKRSQRLELITADAKRWVKNPNEENESVWNVILAITVLVCFLYMLVIEL